MLSLTETVVIQMSVLPHSSVTSNHKSTFAGQGAKVKSTPSIKVTVGVNGPVALVLTPKPKLAIAEQLSELLLFRSIAGTVTSQSTSTS